MAVAHSPTLDPDEVARFGRLSGEWWDERGRFRQLHRINPMRLTYIRDQFCQRFGRNAKQAASLSGLNVLDIGCGGGLVCEPLARLGAHVTGIDPAAENIAAAKAHASAVGLNIAYEVATAEELAARGQNHDAVLLLEVVEHVPDMPAFIKTVAPLVNPSGVMILSTLNRTLKSYALAIVGAEFVLHWLPVGTHQWQRFVTPEELRAALRAAGLSLTDTEGLIYDPFSDEWRLGSDTDVNYFASAIMNR
jgi:2-polyprenyl-6-hydroxyphenyl methylase / 3-demethylubiquinone-9 3-methyltransferase